MAMFKAFKPSGMEKIARSMGYQGNMQGFQNFLAQDPMRQQKMNDYTNKAMQMARGGIVKRLEFGNVFSSFKNSLLLFVVNEVEPLKYLETSFVFKVFFRSISKFIQVSLSH